VNLDASLALIAAARGRVVHVSSASVYGRGEALAEDAPLAPLVGFRYAEHKAALDDRVAAVRPDAAILRPHIILGPHALPLLRRLARLPVYPRLADPQPRVQAVHEADVAAGIVAALHADARGAFNLAHSRTFAWKELVLRHSSYAVPVALPVLALLLHAAWRASGWGGEPGWLAGARDSLTVDCTRAARVLGWKATLDPLEAA
jgi:nucleoside-diphosphate-sugar epimerase